MTKLKWVRKQKALAFENGCVWGAAIVAMALAIRARYEQNREDQIAYDAMVEATWAR